jgi:hypothetical protein
MGVGRRVRARAIERSEAGADAAADAVEDTK